jgi:hypothetical protein
MTAARALPPRVRRLGTLLVVAAIAAALSGVAPAIANPAVDGGKPTPAQLGLPASVHAPSAAERRALPASLASAAVAVSYPAYVWNQHSAKCMEVYASSTANGAKVNQWTCNRNANQKWTWIALAGSYYTWKIVNVASGKCLDTSGSTANGVQLTQWACQATNPNQVFWRISNSASNYVWRFGPASRPTGAVCVEVYHSSYLNGAKVNQWTCNGTQTQNWSESPA